MSIIDDLANEVAKRVPALLGGSGTPTAAPTPQTAKLFEPPVDRAAQAEAYRAKFGAPQGMPAGRIPERAPVPGADKLRGYTPDTSGVPRGTGPSIDTAKLAQRSGALDAAFAKAGGPAQTFSAPPAGANPNIGVAGSAEAQAFRAAQAAEMGPPRPTTVAGEAVAPRNVSLLPQGVKDTFAKGIDAAKSTFSAQMPHLPQGDGTIAKAARFVGRAGMGAAKTAARVAEPVIEGARIAQVAMDPTMTKADVAQQTAEGVARWGATAGGAALGAGVGAMTGPAAPVLSPVGAVAGGIAGYVGGDKLVSQVRAMVGLGDKSPVQRSDERIKAMTPAPAAPAAAANPPGTVDGPNGSKVAVDPAAGTAVLTQRPTEPAAPQGASGANAGAVSAPTVAGEAKAATKAPRGRKAAAAGPVAAEASMDGVPKEDQKAFSAFLQRQSDPNQVGFISGATVVIDGVRVPFSVVEGGSYPVFKYVQAAQKGFVDKMAPHQAAAQVTADASRDNAATQAAAHIEAAGISAGASRYGHDRSLEGTKYSADKQAENVKRSLTTYPEMVDDGMGGTKVLNHPIQFNPATGNWERIDAAGTAPRIRDKNGKELQFVNGQWVPVKQ